MMNVSVSYIPKFFYSFASAPTVLAASALASTVVSHLVLMIL